MTHKPCLRTHERVSLLHAYNCSTFTTDGLSYHLDGYPTKCKCYNTSTIASSLHLACGNTPLLPSIDSLLHLLVSLHRSTFLVLLHSPCGRLVPVCLDSHLQNIATNQRVCQPCTVRIRYFVSVLTAFDSAVRSSEHSRVLECTL
jgi:hypothetical protein